MQSEEKQNLHFGQLALSMQTYTIASQITLIPLMAIILISNAFNAEAIHFFVHAEIHIMAMKLPHPQDKIASGRQKSLIEGFI